MNSKEQKRIWKREKEQMLRDKKRQPREVRKRAVDLKFGGVKPEKNSPPRNSPSESTSQQNGMDRLLRERLGL